MMVSHPVFDFPGYVAHIIMMVSHPVFDFSGYIAHDGEPSSV